MDDEEIYGIDKEHGHPRALEIIPDDFFWDCGDDLAPFGSDEGDMALAEYRDWRKANPATPLEACLIWTIESVAEIGAAEYSDAIFNEATVRQQIDDPEFDDQHYIYTTDVSVIATVFGQLADEGTIDASAKPYAERALKRQIVWAGLQPGWEYAGDYIANLKRLETALAEA
ncbi:hypothetical protein [Pseudoduganella violaceinigra]|uniref:hypothetical protein n=1 Tax=Pseudoduganella violaceinigra TaxID=246602 RepID=UPI0004092B68|nr:hypothetical protein [Pseudoduganella violaceinigra]